MRLIVRNERLHPGAQLRFTDADGMRSACFAKHTVDAAISRPGLRHRQRARAEDRFDLASSSASARSELFVAVALQMDRSHIDTVLVAGKPVKRGRAAVSDSTELIAEARRARGSCLPAVW